MSDYCEMMIAFAKLEAKLDRIEEMLITEGKVPKEVEYKFSFEPTFEGQGEMVLPEDLVYSSVRQREPFVKITEE